MNINNQKGKVMKRISLVFAIAVGFMACGDNPDYDTGTEGSIDSAITEPSLNEPDNTTTPMDTATMDTSSGINQGGASSQYPTPEAAADGNTDPASGNNSDAGNAPAGSTSPGTDNQQTR